MIRSSLTPSEPVIVNCDAKLLMSVRPLAGTNGKASSHDPIAAGIARSPPCTTLIPCAVSEPGSDLQLQSLASFFFGALFQCRLARKLYAALVVDADAFDPNHVAHLDHVFAAIPPQLRQLANTPPPLLPPT